MYITFILINKHTFDNEFHTFYIVIITAEISMVY